ncbi:MAG: DUF885 family protein [Acidobacteria bacterium]|nr:DUF885 family protein [Acidobacteriota bacterium]
MFVRRLDHLRIQDWGHHELCAGEDGKGKVRLYVRVGCSKNWTFDKDGIEDGAAREGAALAFAARLRAVFDREVVPAVQRYTAFLEDTYLEGARESIAVSGNPNGEQCYPAAVRYFATIAPSAAEIHALGLEQIAAIRAEMLEVIEAHWLFDLPGAAKDAIRRSRDNAWGYYDEELTKNRPDWKEVFDFGAERESGDPAAALILCATPGFDFGSLTPALCLRLFARFFGPPALDPSAALTFDIGLLARFGLGFRAGGSSLTPAFFLGLAAGFGLLAGFGATASFGLGLLSRIYLAPGRGFGAFLGRFLAALAVGRGPAA